MNLATALRRCSCDEQAEVLAKVLKLEPRHLLALLMKAELFELGGKPKAAARVYQDALQSIPPGTRLPSALRAPLQRALATKFTTSGAGLRQPRRTSR